MWRNCGAPRPPPPAPDGTRPYMTGTHTHAALGETASEPGSELSIKATIPLGSPAAVNPSARIGWRATTP